MRQRLADRRYSETFEFKHDDVPFTVTYGRNKPGFIQEVFINGGKIGSGLEVMVNDAATVISVALQSEVTPKELLKSMRRDPNGKLASPIGLILADMVKHDG